MAKEEVDGSGDLSLDEQKLTYATVASALVEDGEDDEDAGEDDDGPSNPWMLVGSSILYT